MWQYRERIGPQAARDIWRRSSYKTKFGITLEQYNRMYDVQKGCCKICGKHQKELSRALAVDHDHFTGKVRDLLCTNCNTALGKFEEDVGLLYNAIEYIDRHLRIGGNDQQDKISALPTKNRVT
jgi:hypothetical protein